MHYGIINAGEAVMEVKKNLKTISGKSHYDVLISGRSYSAFDPFYKVRDYYESFIDVNTLLPRVFLREVNEDKYHKTESYIFDRQNNVVISKKIKHPVAAGMQDIISAFYYLRCIDFSKQQVGSYFPVTAYMDDSLFPLGVKYTGTAIIDLPVGKINCYVFKPKLIKGRIFSNQDDMTLYVSKDKNQIPVRVESAILVGSVKADLISYSGLKYPFTAKVGK